MSYIYLIHGFNVRDNGTSSIDTLKNDLKNKGHKVIDVNYGFFQRLRVRLCNKSVARLIASIHNSYSSYTTEESVIIGHSNGCAIIHQACQLGAKFDKAILINPALDSDLAIPRVDSFKVFYSPTDKATMVAKYIPWSPWGNMGRVGYTGGDPRGSNVNMDVKYGLELGHSGVFHDVRPRARLLKDIYAYFNT